MGLVMAVNMVRGLREGPGIPAFTATLSRTDHATVLTLTGKLDITALPTCRHAALSALQTGSEFVLLDLGEVRFSMESVAVLGLVRRYLARHRVEVLLTNVPPQVAGMLAAARVSALYPVLMDRSAS